MIGPLLAALLAAPSIALAAPPDRPIVAVEVVGGGGHAREAIVAALAEDAQVTNPGELRATLGATRQRSMTAVFDDAARPASTKWLKKAGEELHSRAVVVARVEGRGRSRRLRMIIVNVATGEASERDVALGASTRNADETSSVREAIEPDVRAILESPPPQAPPAQAPEIPAAAVAQERPAFIEPTPLAVPDAAADRLASPARDDERPLLFEIGAFAGAGGRSFNYNDGLSAHLHSFELPIAPVTRIQAEVKPLEPLRIRALSNLSVFGSFTQALLVSGVTGTGNRVDATWQEYDAGVRYRVLGSSGAVPAVALAASYGDQRFAFASTLPSSDTPPSVDYTYVRGGLELRWQLGGLVALTAAAGYRYVLGEGGLQTQFPRLSGGAVDATMGGAVRISSHFEARLALAYARYFFSMNPQPGDPFVAGGALDEFATATVGAAFLE